MYFNSEISRQISQKQLKLTGFRLPMMQFVFPKSLVQVLYSISFGTKTCPSKNWKQNLNKIFWGKTNCIMGNVKVTSFHMSISKIPLLVFNRYSRWINRLFHWVEWQVISGPIQLKCFGSLKILSEQIVNGPLFMLLNDPQFN